MQRGGQPFAALMAGSAATAFGDAISIDEPLGDRV